MDTLKADQVQSMATRLRDSVQQVIVGNDRAIDLAIATKARIGLDRASFLIPQRRRRPIFHLRPIVVLLQRARSRDYTPLKI